MKKIFLAAIGCIIIVTAGPLFAFAQEGPTTGINLTVSPVFVSLVTEPGRPATSQIRIRNNSNVSESLRIRTAIFETGSDGAPVLREAKKDDPSVSWLTFSQNLLTLSPNETKTIGVRLAPPKTAALGYYYAAIFTRERETQKGSVSQAVIAASPAVPILLEVISPNAKRELQLVDFQTDHLFYEYLPSNFTLKIKNTGNIHIVPVGDIFVDSSYREDIAVIPVNSGHGNVLPGATRSFQASWNDGFAIRIPEEKAGKTSYKTIYDFAKANKFRIGKYSANILMIYDNGQRDIPLEATLSFWVIPWKIIGGVLIIAYFMFIGLKDQVGGIFRRLKK